MRQIVVTFLALLVCPHLLADSTWTLKDVTFADGGTAAGTFVFRLFPQPTLLDFNIATSGGTLPSFIYTPSSSRGNVYSFPGVFVIQFDVNPPVGGGTTRRFFLQVAQFADFSGSIVIGITSQESFTSQRRVTGGSIEGIPGQGAMERSEAWLPIAGSARGAGGEFFRTNVRIFNPATTQQTVKVWFLPAGRENLNAAPREYTLPGRSMLELDDAVGQLGGSGLGAFRVGSAAGSVRVTANIFTDSKCTTPVSGGIFGQFAVATDRDTAAKSKASIVHLRSDSQARSNIGFSNPTATEASITIRIFGVDDAEIGSAQVTVPPFGATAPLNIESLIGTIGQESVWVSYESTQPVFAYGSVVDAKTSDQYFVPAIPES